MNRIRGTGAGVAAGVEAGGERAGRAGVKVERARAIAA